MFHRPPSVSRNFISAPGAPGTRTGRSARRARRARARPPCGGCAAWPSRCRRDRASRSRAPRSVPASFAASCRELMLMPTKMCAARAAVQPIVELGDHAAAERRAELAERAGPLGNRHREDRFARFAQLGAFGDEAQAIEVHVRAAQHRDQIAAQSRCACATTALRARRSA